ncbi:tetratricopeptide repeat protein [Oscillochloris sp. ZM17-4]|uniref:tetratricopeptide repeat protein n=1 Tax=Oscillochloris sp. ZM17-4 TaxID=2866714 RepID=UPI001C736284|nr:tetratricopeptide repeat protein [Oscillochloris sp. ZM17-4]MBX0329553.1 tetratricopeptide repeat protein [Oscillochloris sp. ZM17-4]
MDLQLILIVLSALAIGLLASMLVLRIQRRKAPPPSRPSTATTIEMEIGHRDGREVADMPGAPAPKRRLVTPTSMIIVGLSLLLIAAGGWFFLSQSGARSADRFVVLVAPFDDGGSGQTGRNVAESLAQQIRQRVAEPITVEVIDQRPTSAQGALDLAIAEQSDMLIWGGVEPGAMLDSQSLSPRLIYTPNGTYAPNGWDGYLGRFRMPRSYALANEPINGQAILPPLTAALFEYGQGQPDRAAALLDGLISDYPALSAPLPRSIRGNVLWARGSYDDAADEYRIALAAPSDEQVLLANNLGAILLDAGDPGVLGAFSDAVRLLEGRDLGELRYNLGLLAMNDQRPADATVELEQARNLLPLNTPLLLSLADAYRESGRLGSAQSLLDAAAAQARADQRLVPDMYRPMVAQRFDAAIREQRGMLGLARSLNAQGPLTWELEVAKPIPEQDVVRQRDELRAAVDASEQTSARWHQRSASDSATDSGAGQVAAGQADRSEGDARRQRYELAILNTELARAQIGRPTSALGQMFGALFGGGDSPIAESLSLLDKLAQRDPNSPAVLLARARALRVNGQLNDADRAYDQVVQVASQRPEGYFGKGVIARDRGDSATAAQLMRIAIDRNGAFFPARFELARIAQESGDQAEAIAQLRALTQQRPGPDAAVALAQALRLSGPSGYVEAEQVLLPLSMTNADAAIELGRLYNDAGRADASIQAYRDALGIDPRSSTASFELGERLAATGDPKGAERALRDAISFDSTNIAARLSLARLYEGPLGQPGRADQEYGVALSQGVSDINTLVAIGDTALANKNPNQAIDAYNRAARIDPNNPLPQYKLARAYFSTNRLQSSADAAQNVVRQTTEASDPSLRALRAQALVILGDVARRQGDLPRATDAYTQAQQIDPQMIDAQIGMGQVAVGQGQWGLALNYFETAASLPGAADNADAQFWLAEGLLRSGDLDRATATYGRAMELRPEFPEALLGIAQVQYAQRNTAAALDTVGRSLALRPNYAEALLFKGKLLQELGRNNEAMSAYNASIRANGQIAESYYRRGLLLISSEKYDDAITDMRKAVRIQPNFPEANYWMGRSYYARGQIQSARDAFKRAVDLNAGYNEALYYLGLAAEDLGSRDEAISAYQTVIVADSSGEWGARARNQLDRIQ